MKPVVVVLISALALLIPSIASAGGSALPDGPYVIADGSAEIDAAPDYAVITFSLASTARTSADAEKIVADKTLAVLKTIRDVGIEDEDIHASAIVVQPEYSYENDKRTYKGQRIERNFEVTLRKLNKYSDFIHGLLDANVDTISNVEFDTLKLAVYQKQALDTAIANARIQAQEMAHAAGTQINKIYAIAPSGYRSAVLQDYPMKVPDYLVTGNRIEVVGTDIGAIGVYLIPKTIAVKSEVTIICTLN